MIFAHAPAGYILTRILQKKLNTKKHLFIGIIGSITPDLDLIYNKYFDPIVGRNHREYITHTPFFWLVLFVVCWSITNRFLPKKRRKVVRPILIIFFGNVFVHMILDMFMSMKIFWPFLDQTFSFITIIDDSNSFPILEYASHPLFWMEMTIFVVFFWVIEKDFKKNFR